MVFMVFRTQLRFPLADSMGCKSMLDRTDQTGTRKGRGSGRKFYTVVSDR